MSAAAPLQAAKRELAGAPDRAEMLSRQALAAEPRKREAQNILIEAQLPPGN
jgi:hypothetical protein